MSIKELEILGRYYTKNTVAKHDLICEHVAKEIGIPVGSLRYKFNLMKTN